MITCTINDECFEYPSKWDEFSKSQLLKVVQLFYSGFPAIDLKISAVLNFMNLKIATADPTYQSPDKLYYVLTKKGVPFCISPDQMIGLSKSLDFLTSTELDEHGEEINTLNSNLTVNLIPEFKIRRTTYYGVSDRLFNMIFDEYLEAEIHFKAYMHNSDITSLNKLIATIYRPKAKRLNKTNVSYNGNPRQSFNSNLTDYYAKKISKVSPEIKIAIFLFYQGCRKFLAINFPNVFSPGTGSKTKGYGSLSLVDALTGDDVTKNIAVRNTMLFDVLVRLENAAIQYEKTKTK